MQASRSKVSATSRAAAVALLTATGAAAPPARAAEAEAAIEILMPYMVPTPSSGASLPSGYWMELIGRAASRASVAVRFRDLPYVRALREVSTGTDACSPVIARTAGHEHDFHWVARTQRIFVSAFALADDAAPRTTVETLKQARIAVVRGTFGDQTLTRLGIPAHRVTAIRQQIEMLKRGRVSIMVADYRLAMQAAADAAILLREVARLAEIAGYFACSPGLDPAIAARLGAAIDDIFERGEDRAIAAARGLYPSYEVMRPVANNSMR